jgi:nicotinate-nucleotide adenylyltransferase
MYGGAFDPPHNAHVALARAAVEQLALDELRIFPTGHAWHRSERLTAPDDRLAMARLAFEGLPQAVVDDREIRRAGPTYTIDTLRELRRDFRDAQLFLVMGEDQARIFTGWHEWAEIARMAMLCIAQRASTSSARTESRVRPGPESPVRPEPVEGPAGARTVMLQLPDMTESATTIRAMVARGEDISLLVPPAVAGYIASHHLYQGH